MNRRRSVQRAGYGKEIRLKENKLIIIRGLPGSGKSTKAKEIVCCDDTETTKHYEADMFHIINGEYCFNVKNIKDAHKWCQASTAYWLNRGCTVVVSNTFTTIKEMEPYFEMAKQYGAYIEVIEMKENYGNVHNVPEDVLQKMADRWEEYK